MTNPSPGLPISVVNHPPIVTPGVSSPVSPNKAVSYPPYCPNQSGEFPLDCPNQSGESPHAPPNSGRESFVSPNFAANCAQNKNSSQHSPSVMRVSKYNGLRAHTHASTRRLCRPCLCFFYNFFINIILFYYWVTNRDFIDLFCHTPKT